MCHVQPVGPSFWINVLMAKIESPQTSIAPEIESTATRNSFDLVSHRANGRHTSIPSVCFGR